MHLLTTLESELLKTKRTAALRLTFITASLGLVIYMMDVLSDGIPPERRTIILHEMLTDKFQVETILVMPLFIVLTCTLLPQIEYKNNAWKQVLASPQSKWTVFVSKFITVQLLIVIFLIIDLLMMLLGAVIMHFTEPALHVLNQSVDVEEVLKKRAVVYVGLSAMCAVQFWLGLRMKNFIKPIGIGIALWMTGLIMVSEAKVSFAEFFPYCYHAILASAKSGGNNNFLWYSSAYTVLFFGLAYWDFRKNRVSA